jgi:hypothetical protein
MNAPQIIPPQVGSAYHQAVYGARAPAIPSMGNIAGYYGGMMSPFNAPLHVVSEVQQAQLRQANELAGANLQRSSERPISRLVGELEAPKGSGLVPLQSAPFQVQPVQPPPVKPKPIRMSFYPGSYDELPSLVSSISAVSDRQPAMSSMPISFSKPSAPLSMEAPEPASASASSSSMEEKPMEAPEQVASSSSESAPRRKPKIAPQRPERGDDQPDFTGIVDWIDRQTVKQGNSPIGLSKDMFIAQVSAQVGRQFTVGNIKNKSFDEIKRRAKKFINDIIDAGR